MAVTRNKGHTSVEEIEMELLLVAKAKEGDAKAIEQLISKYTGYMLYTARKYYARGFDFEDMCQELRIAFCGIIVDYKSDFGVPFHKFARTCLRKKAATTVRTWTTCKVRMHTDASSIYKNVDMHDESTSTILETTVDKMCLDPLDIIVDTENVQDFWNLTERVLSKLELEAVNLKITGKSYKDIADDLGVDAKTIDNAITRAKLKLKPYYSIV